MKEDIRKEIEQMIYYDTDILSKDIPGYSIALIYQDSIFTYHFGSTDFDKTAPLHDHTIFELGGLTKVFTASLIEILVQDGIMAYEDTFNSFLDDTERNADLKDLKILDLVSHYSGLPKMPFEFGVKEKEIYNPYAHYTKADLLDFYKKYIPGQEEPQYFYSSVNYALLEIAIERKTGKSFETILSQKLLQPLGLEQSFVHIKSDQLPCPGFSIGQQKMPALKFQSFAASEGLKSSLSDLAKFIGFNLGKENSGLTTKLQALHQPIHETKLNKSAKIGKGWHVVKLKKYYDVILHSGSTNGHRAYMGFVKETQTGVVVLSNSKHSMDGLGFLILRMLNHNWKKKKKKR